MELHAATDITDEFITYGTYYTEEQIDEIMLKLQELGTKKLEWVMYEDRSLVYKQYPLGFDLLKTAVDSAHRHGMELHAVIKPFEACNALHLPHTYPQPEGGMFWKDLRGLSTLLNPFVIEHPEYCMKRRPGQADPGGPVRKINLVKGDDRELDFKLDDLSIWIGSRLGEFKPYTGPVTVRENVEWRALFPWERNARVIHFEDLDIPEDHPYIEIRLDADGQGDFRCEIDHMLEWYGEDNTPIPITMGSSSAYGEPKKDGITPWEQKVNRYFLHPEVQEFLKNEDLDPHWENMRNFDCRQSKIIMDNFAERKRATAVRGKNPYIPLLNPIYPEVREFWLSIVEFCLERGVDGIDMRASSHFRCNEMQEYGFNDATLEATGGSLNRAEVAKVNGKAYTELMRQTRELTHQYGKKFGVHLIANMIQEEDDQGKTSNLPMNIAWEYETWINKLADYAVFRGAMGLQKHHLEWIVDSFSALTHEAGIPLAYQSNRRHVHRDSSLESLSNEMHWVLDHPYIDAYQLYETNSMFSIQDGETICSPDLAELVGKYRDKLS